MRKGEENLAERVFSIDFPSDHVKTPLAFGGRPMSLAARVKGYLILTARCVGVSNGTLHRQQVSIRRIHSSSYDYDEP